MCLVLLWVQKKEPVIVELSQLPAPDTSIWGTVDQVTLLRLSRPPTTTLGSETKAIAPS